MEYKLIRHEEWETMQLDGVIVRPIERPAPGKTLLSGKSGGLSDRGGWPVRSRCKPPGRTTGEGERGEEIHQ